MFATKLKRCRLKDLTLLLFRRFGAFFRVFFLLCAALCLTQAPLFLWKGYAWVTMLQERTPLLGFQDAVEETFSGDHPCPHCVAIQKTEERQKDRLLLLESEQRLQGLFNAPLSYICGIVELGHEKWPLPSSLKCPPLVWIKLEIQPPDHSGLKSI